jgi:hypothetical protein
MSSIFRAETTPWINCKACEAACRAERDAQMSYSRDCVKDVGYLNATGMPELRSFPAVVSIAMMRLLGGLSIRRFFIRR